MFARPLIRDGAQVREAGPGDLLGAGEDLSIGVLATNGAGTWTGAAIASGFITRTTVGAPYTDTTDTAANIITALKGNATSLDSIRGSTFRFRFINTIAQAMTFAAGEGVVGSTTLGSGTLDCAASQIREYVIRVDNATPRVGIAASNGNASKTITFDTAQPMGTVTPGMQVVAANITTGTLVVGLTLNGEGKISGVTTDTNSTGVNAAGTAMVFSPQVTIASIGRLGAL